MASIEELEIVTSNNRNWLMPRERGFFPEEEWVPALVGVIRASSVQRQREAIAHALIGFGGRYGGLWVQSPKRIIPLGVGAKDARLRLEPATEEERLAYLRVHTGTEDIRVGYQSPEPNRPNLAYAVIDSPELGYHRVVGTPGEGITITEQMISEGLVQNLAEIIHSHSPGFGIYSHL